MTNTITLYTSYASTEPKTEITSTKRSKKPRRKKGKKPATKRVQAAPEEGMEIHSCTSSKISESCEEDYNTITNLVEALVLAGANPNYPNAESFTPAMAGCRYRCYGELEKLDTTSRGFTEVEAYEVF